MRLTLRTLLAYLDDTLDAESTKTIGQKVAESPVAQELIERIKKVTRRRSLANPSVQGDTSRLDPNTVAEYLDSELSAEDLPQVEQTCLEDDVYLAEVAACHQILTLMLSEPSRVPPPSRQRMYRLVKGRESIPYRRPPAYFADVERNGSAPAEAGETRTSRWPLYLATAAVLAIGLIASLALAWPRSQPTRSQGPVEVSAVAPTMNIDSSPKMPDPAKPGAPAAAGKNNSPKYPPMPEPVPPAASATEPVRKPIDAIPIDEPSAERSVIGTFVTAGSLLLENRSGGAKEDWKPIKLQDDVLSGTRLMSLPGYRNEVKFTRGVSLLLWGNLLEFMPVAALECVVITHSPAAGVDVDLTLDHGRIMLTNTKTDGPVRVRFRFRTEVWDLVMGPRAQVLVNGQNVYPPGLRFSKQGGGEAPLSQLSLGMVRGKTTVQIRDMAPIDLTEPPGPGLLNWDNKGRLKEPGVLDGPLPNATPTMPARSPAKEFAAEFKAVLDGLYRRMAEDGATLPIALTELSQDDRPFAQAYAAYALPTIDVIAPVVDALDDLLKPAVPRAAIPSLRHWIARSQENALTLHELLIRKKNYTENQADAALMLLHSFTEEDFKDPATLEFILSELNDEKLSIRLLAYWHMDQLDPEGAKATGFDPGLTDKREDAIGRWRRRLIERKVLPKPVKTRNVSSENAN